MVVMNKNAGKTSINTNRFAEIIKGKKEATNVLTGEQLLLGSELSLPAKAALILELK